MPAVVLGYDRRTRIRVKQWLIAAAAYAGGAVVMTTAFLFGWLTAHQLAAWLGTLAVVQMMFYFTLRSGLSARLEDPALTVLQIVAGLLFANWAFVSSGPGRAVALVPMLLVMIFGAFVLHWKKIAALTCFALGSFGMFLAALQWLRWKQPGPAFHEEWRQDLLYFASLVFLLPLAALLAAQVSRMRHTLRARRDALVIALAEVQRLAEFDELTDLANRRRASAYLTVQHAQAQHTGSELSLILIDLDNFKQINDTLGHGAGDKALRAFADAARPLMRANDLMARWGGEEFLIIMPNTSPDNAYNAALRLLERVRAFSSDNGGPLSFSAGIAQWKPEESIAHTVVRADRCMYIAKRAGRNQISMGA
ncbi:MAG: GGDEF domain-containing protein [Rhodanobacter sp.]